MQAAAEPPFGQSCHSPGTMSVANQKRLAVLAVLIVAVAALSVVNVRVAAVAGVCAGLFLFARVVGQTLR